MGGRGTGEWGAGCQARISGQHPSCSLWTQAAEPCLYEQGQDDLYPRHRDPSCLAMSESESPGSQPALSLGGSEHPGGSS